MLSFRPRDRQKVPTKSITAPPAPSWRLPQPLTGLSLFYALKASAGLSVCPQKFFSRLFLQGNQACEDARAWLVLAGVSHSDKVREYE